MEGKLLNISDACLKETRNFRENINIGSGSIYSGDTCIRGISPTLVINNNAMSLEESMKESKKKIVSTIVMFFIGVLVMVGK